MERTADFNATDFAKFVVKILDDPTKGQIYDALSKTGFPDDEVQVALTAVQGWTDNASVDSVENPDDVVEEGRDPDDSSKPEDGMTLGDLASDADKLTTPDEEDQGIVIPDSDDPDHRLDDEFDKGGGDVLDEDVVNEETDQVGENVNLSGEDLLKEVGKFLSENPAHTDADVERHLFGMGIPGDRLREFMKGLKTLTAGHRIAHLVFSDVSYSDAAVWAAKNNPKLKAEDIKQILINDGGATEREADDAISTIPPEAATDPMPDGPTDDSMGPDMGGGMDPGMMGGPPGDMGDEPLPDPSLGDANQMDPAMAGDPAAEGTEEGAPPAEDDGFDAVADQYLENNPDIQREGLMEILKGEGASPERAAELADAKLGAEEETFDPQVDDRVRTPRGAARVAHIHETLNGNVYTVETDTGEREYFGINALSAYKEEKTSSENIWGRIESHMTENWYSDMDRLPHATKKSYEERVEKSEQLRKEIRGLISEASADEQVHLARIDDALENEVTYCKDKLKTSFDAGEAEYLTRQPQFSVVASSTNQRIGPGGGTFHQAALDAAQEIASIDWKYEVTAGADLFVEDVEPKYIADAGEVRRRAARYIEAKVAVLPEEDATPVVKTFMANVEKARKSAAIQVRKTAGTHKEAAVELPDNFEEGLFY